MNVAYATIHTATGRPANTDHLAARRSRSLGCCAGVRRECTIDRGRAHAEKHRRCAQNFCTTAPYSVTAPVCCANQDDEFEDIGAALAV